MSGSRGDGVRGLENSNNLNSHSEVTENRPPQKQRNYPSEPPWDKFMDPQMEYVFKK